MSFAEPLEPLEPANPADVEPLERRKKRLRSIYMVHGASMAMGIGFTIMLTGTLPYLKRLLPNSSEETVMKQYAWVTAAIPIGQFFVSPLFGVIANKLGSIRLISLITSGLFAAAGVITALLSLVKESNRFWLFFLSRLFSGIAQANKVPFRSYVASATYKHERTQHIAFQSAARSIGSIVGPLIQAALTAVGCTDHTGDATYFSLDTYTLACWLSALCGVVSAFLFLPGIYSEYDVSGEEKDYINRTTGPSDSDQVSEKLAKPDYFTVYSLLFSFFLIVFNFAIVESLATPICFDQFGWSESDTLLYMGIIMAVGGIFNMFFYGIMGFLSKIGDERAFLLFGIFLMLSSKLLMLPFPGSAYPVMGNTTADGSAESIGLRIQSHDSCEEQTGPQYCNYDWCEKVPAIQVWQFVLGVWLTSSAFPFCVALSTSIMSKVLGPRPQGLYMGLQITFGSLSRALSPISITQLYVEHGPTCSIGTVAAFMVICIAINTLLYKRLIPLDDRLRKENRKKMAQVMKKS